MQIKTLQRYHLTPVGKNIKIFTLINAGEGVEKKELSYIVGGYIDWYSHYGEQYGGPLKTKNGAALRSCNSTPGHMSGENSN